MSDDIEVRPEVMEALQSFVDSEEKGVELMDSALIPNETELSEFPELTLRVTTNPKIKRGTGFFLLNLEAIFPPQ